MNAFGWTIFIASNVVVLSLVICCFVRVLRSGEHMHAPLDIDTHDLDDSDEESLEK